MKISHPGRQPGGSAPAHGALAKAAAWLSLCIGMQGCIENPGTDHRLNQRDHDYHFVATAGYADESVLELSVKHDSGAVSLRILSLAREPIDSASFLLQFGEQHSYVSPNLYHGDSRLNVIVRIANLQPGATLDYGRISRDMELGYTDPSAVLIRFADGATRGAPLGGVYNGNYAFIDSTGRRHAGPMKGIITADGEYQFHMDMVLTGGIKGDWYGRLDSTRREGVLFADFFGTSYPTTMPAPFTLDSGALTGSFLVHETGLWFDSLGFEMQPMRYIGE